MLQSPKQTVTSLDDISDTNQKNNLPIAKV